MTQPAAPPKRRFEEWLIGWPGVTLAFLWGVAEGCFFFLVPDILITLAAIFSPRRSLVHLAAVVSGSLLGGGSMYAWAASQPANARAAVARVPFVAVSMFDTVAADLQRDGAWGLCRGPLSGIPYKVYAVEAPPYVPLGAFLVVSVPARLERLLITWILFAAVGMLAQQALITRRWLIAGHAIYWAAVYAYYWKI